MSEGVEFDEDQFGMKPRPNYGGQPGTSRPGMPGGMQNSGYQVPSSARNEPKMVQFLMRHGLAKSPVAAQVILVVIIAINIIITYVVVKFLL